MRITQNIIANNSIYNLQQGRAKLDKLAEQIGTGANINRPSDDPNGTRLLLSIGDQIKSGDQYAGNIGRATTSLKVTGTALQGMSDIMALAKKVANNISSGSNNPADLAGAVAQLTTLKQQMIDLGNTQMGDQYIFGGASNQSLPFMTKAGDLIGPGASTVSNVDITGLKAGMQVSGTGIPAGTVIGTFGVNSFALVDSANVAVTATATTTGSALNFYNGDGSQTMIEIAKNTTQALNVTGDRLLKGTGANPSYGSTDIFKAFDDLITAVNANDAAGIQAGTQELEAGAKQINNAQSDTALRLVRLDSMTKMNANVKNTLEAIVSNTQNVDYAKLGVELTQQQTAFSASLSTTAKTSQLSLLDYLR